MKTFIGIKRKTNDSNGGAINLNVKLDLRACRVCLATDTKLFNLHENRLAQTFGDLTGTPVSVTDGLPQHICNVCGSLLQKSAAFRAKCRQMHIFLQDARVQTPLITTEYLRSIDKTNVKPALTITHVLALECIPQIDQKEQEEPGVEEQTIDEEYIFKLDEADDFLDDEEDKQAIDTEVKLENDFTFKSTNINTKPYSLTETCLRSKDKTNVKPHLTTTHVLALECIPQIDQKEQEEPGIEEETIDEKNFIELDATDDFLDDKEDKKTIDEEGKSENDFTFKSIDINTKPYSLTETREIDTGETKIKKRKPPPKQVKKVKKVNLGIDTPKPEKIRKKAVKKKKRMFNSKTEEDFVGFSKTYNVDVAFLTREQQLQDVQSRKESKEYLSARFQCDICYEGFISVSAYRKHMDKHNPSSGDHICDICHIRFPERVRMLSHKRCIHKAQFTCRVCKHISKTSTTAEIHSKWHQGLKYECRHCFKSFKIQSSYLNHVRENHKSITCDVCQESVSGTKGLAVHKEIVHYKKNNCNTCGTQFPTEDALLSHFCEPCLRTCAQCGEQLYGDEQFDKHVARVHIKPAKLQNVILQGSNSKGQKKRDISKCCTCPHFEHGEDGGGEHNVPTGDSCPCSNDDGDKCLCPTSSVFRCKFTEQDDPTNKTGFSRRKWGHRGCCKERRLLKSCLMCEVCGTVCQHEANLRIHQRVHTGERPYQCDVCSRRFRVKTSLIIHMYTHTGNAPYKCSLCPKSFGTHFNREMHRLVHTQERRHRCEVCDKMFRTSSDLNCHVRSVHMKIPRRPAARVRQEAETRVSEE